MTPPDAPQDAPAEAATEAAAEADADVASVPDAAGDAPDAASRADAQPDALTDARPDAPTDASPDAASSPDAGIEAGPSDAGAPPNINVMHPAMALSVLMRRTCAAGLSEGCDEVQSQAFEASCSVRGTRFSLYFLPCARGITQCGEVFSGIDGAFASIASSNSIGSVPAQGGDAFLTPGLEWVDAAGQRRQNFHVRARLAADPMRARGISGIYGRTALPEYADFYALGCPKGH